MAQSVGHWSTDLELATFTCRPFYYYVGNLSTHIQVYTSQDSDDCWWQFIHVSQCLDFWGHFSRSIRVNTALVWLGIHKQQKLLSVHRGLSTSCPVWAAAISGPLTFEPVKHCIIAVLLSHSYGFTFHWHRKWYEALWVSQYISSMLEKKFPLLRSQTSSLYLQNPGWPLMSPH